MPQDLRPPPWPEASEGTLLAAGLSVWARACPRPLVLFFDEIDALSGQSLISVLSQLRDGYRDRPTTFPTSIALCGLRDCHSPEIASRSRGSPEAASGGDPSRLGTSSPFNIQLESLRLGDFTADEVAHLYGQHTADTGQEFTSAAVARAFELTAGQPWLVNALAREIVVKLEVPASQPITVDHMEQAKERLVLARATHLDSLAARLAEPRVRRIAQPLLAGDLVQLDPYDDDLAYTRDLGLIATTNPVRIANPIYREVIVRVLTTQVEANIVTDPRSFVLPDGRVDVALLLREFAEFWIEHGDVLTTTEHYHEVAPQLVLMGFLQRVVVLPSDRFAIRRVPRVAATWTGNTASAAEGSTCSSVGPTPTTTANAPRGPCRRPLPAGATSPAAQSRRRSRRDESRVAPVRRSPIRVANKVRKDSRNDLLRERP